MCGPLSSYMNHGPSKNYSSSYPSSPSSVSPVREEEKPKDEGIGLGTVIIGAVAAAAFLFWLFGNEE